MIDIEPLLEKMDEQCKKDGSIWLSFGCYIDLDDDFILKLKVERFSKSNTKRTKKIDNLIKRELLETHSEEKQ
jgi:hypothetical protein